MRFRPTLCLSAAVLGLLALTLPAVARAQTTTSSCAAGSATTITGTVYAPNGTDPLPNVTVYVPTTDPGAMPVGVQCPTPGALPAGAPLIGTTSATDGTFTLTGVPVSTAVPVVIIAGKWRRQFTVDTTMNACGNTAAAATLTRFPRNQGEGDIPKFAIATGSSDQVECVLLKVGLDPAEFTDAGGTGRINLYQATGSAGARISLTTASASTLTGDSTNLANYDVLMLPCEGGNYRKPATDLANVVNYANEGGRIYSSHYGYEWMYENAPFNQVVAWNGSSQTLPDGTATVNQSFASGATLAAWLQITGASTALGQISINTVRSDFSAINPPTQSYLTLNNAAYSNPTMQFTFNTPVGASTGQCGRVLFNEYHVENPPSSPKNVIFPAECSTAAMTAQEKLLEYSLFDLTNDGGAPTMTPASADFGTEAVGFQSAPQTFTWQNNSVFSSGVTSAAASGDFLVTGNNCGSVASGATCSINVAFKPTTSGARTGTLTVTSSANTLTAALSGQGVPTLTLSSLNLDFGKVDVGASATQTVILTNNAPGVVAFPALATTGDFTVGTNCPASLPAAATCAVSITFKPSATGTRAGTMSATSADPAYAAVTSTFTGIGTDFSLALTPTSGAVIAGRGVTTSLSATAIAGFANNLAVTCSSPTPGTTCTVVNALAPSAAGTSAMVSISTTSKYTVIGYGGYASGLAALLGVCGASLMWFGRRRSPALARLTMAVFALAAAASLTTGCSGKLPAENSVYTGPGTYTVTLSATDGFLVHTATYQLTVTAN